MNLIFVVIALLFVICFVMRPKKPRLSIASTGSENRSFQVMFTDKENLSKDIANPSEPVISKKYASNQDIRISISVDGKEQKVFQNHSSESSGEANRGESDLMISVNILE